MKLDELLREFPWDDTYRRLCSEPPDQDELPMGRARDLIVEERDSQVAVLSRSLYGPRLVTEASTQRRMPVRSTESSRLPRFELSDPVDAAQTFLRVAAQVGASLRPFAPERLTELDKPDAWLGRLLRLLASTEEPARTPPTDREEWQEVAAAVRIFLPAPAFGPVLTPMLLLAAVPPALAAGRSYASELIWSLVGEIGATDRRDELAVWLARVVDAGSTHIEALGLFGGLSAELSDALRYARPLPPIEEIAWRGPHGDHARDVVLAGDRDANAYVLKRIQSIPEVKQTDFVYEPEPGVVRIRAWSEMPVSGEPLIEIADEAGAKIIEILDDVQM